MGYNSHGALKVLIDIETAPLPEAAEFLDFSDISAPANYKDEAKIVAYCESKKQELVNRAALDLDLCRIVAIGWQEEGRDKVTTLTMATDATESLGLETFWRALDDRTTIGYNQVGFDLPILLRRSLYLGVDTPTLNLDKYRTNHLDLQQKLSLNGTKPYRSLQWYCKRLKLDTPQDDAKGSEIGELVKAGKWDEIAAHCRADVLRTKALAERLGYLKVQQPVTEAAF